MQIKALFQVKQVENENEQEPQQQTKLNKSKNQVILS